MNSNNILIMGLSKHHLLRDLYNAARPVDKKITAAEAAAILNNTIGMVTEVYGKKLYVDVFGKEMNSSTYDAVNGEGLAKSVVSHAYHRLLFGDPVWEWEVNNEQETKEETASDEKEEGTEST